MALCPERNTPHDRGHQVEPHKLGFFCCCGCLFEWKDEITWRVIAPSELVAAPYQFEGE